MKKTYENPPCTSCYYSNSSTFSEAAMKCNPFVAVTSITAAAMKVILTMPANLVAT